jgi:hypothetical protein
MLTHPREATINPQAKDDVKRGSRFCLRSIAVHTQTTKRERPHETEKAASRKPRSFKGLNPTIFRQAQDFASFLALQMTQPYSRVADIADEAWVTRGHTQTTTVSLATAFCERQLLNSAITPGLARETITAY